MISCVVNTEESALTNVNDSIFTSGLGGVFMPNIKVGEILEINAISIDESEVIIKLIDDPLEQTLFGIVG
jgi:cell shape-determining protein MreC